MMTPTVHDAKIVRLASLIAASASNANVCAFYAHGKPSIYIYIYIYIYMYIYIYIWAVDKSTL